MKLNDVAPLLGVEQRLNMIGPTLKSSTLRTIVRRTIVHTGNRRLVAAHVIDDCLNIWARRPTD